MEVITKSLMRLGNTGKDKVSIGGPNTSPFNPAGEIASSHYPEYPLVIDYPAFSL